MVFIYRILHQDTGETLYVGQTRDTLAGRLRAHVNSTRPLGRWLKSQHSMSHMRYRLVRIEALVQCEAGPYADFLECRAIAAYKPKFNVATGGRSGFTWKGPRAREMSHA